MTLNVARIRAICFDVDGTLRDTDDQYVEYLLRWSNPFRFLIHHRKRRHIARWIVMRLETPATFLYGLPDKLGIDSLLNRFAEQISKLGPGHRKAQYAIVPGVRELVADLYQAFPLAVISARSYGITQAFLDEYHLTRYFRCIATAQTCRRAKPYPDQVYWAAEQMGVPPASILMVGDTTVDMHAAVAAGAQAVGVLCGFGEAGELRSAGAGMLVQSTADLRDILLSVPTNE